MGGTRLSGGGAGHGRRAVPDSRISVLVVAGLSVVLAAVEAVVAVASVVAAVVGATGGTVGTVVASVVAAVAGASVLLTVPGTPTVVGGDVGGAKGKCKITASGRSGWTHGPACKAGSPRDRWSGVTGRLPKQGRWVRQVAVKENRATGREENEACAFHFLLKAYVAQSTQHAPSQGQW